MGIKLWKKFEQRLNIFNEILSHIHRYGKEELSCNVREERQRITPEKFLIIVTLLEVKIFLSLEV